MSLNSINNPSTVLRTVVAVAVVLAGIVSSALGQSAKASPPGYVSTPASENRKASLSLVHLNGNYFELAGKAFIPVGVNWVPAMAAMEWPYQWDPKAIEADFAKMHSLGLNAVRLDLVWPWFEPRPGVYNQRAFDQLNYLVTLANKYSLYLNPELLVGGEVGEAYWDVPYRQGRDPQSDPYMLRLETDFARELGRRFQNDPAILAWDLTDEPPFWISQNTTDSMAINWTRLIAGGLRAFDPQHLIVVGTSDQDWTHGPFRSDIIRDEVNFFSVHPYTIYQPGLFPDAMLSVRQTYGAAFATALSEGAGRPVMVQELGASSAQYSPEKIAQYEQASLYSSLGAGANGFLIWCYSDAAPTQYAKVPYLRSPHETQFGITTWDGKERPSGKVLSQFAATTAAMKLDGVAPVQGEAAILVPNEWSKAYGDQSHFGLPIFDSAPYTSVEEGGSVAGQSLPDTSQENSRLEGAWLSSFIMAREAGLKAEFPREYGNWQKYKMLLLPSPLTGTDVMMTHLHSDFWEKAKQYVQNGGTIFASVSGDAAIPHMEELFGARLADNHPVNDVALTIVAPFGSLKTGDVFRFSARSDAPQQWAATLKVMGGQVIAVDQNGKAALVAHRLGQGRTLLSAYPVELYLATKPQAFEQGDATYRIYQALAEWAHIQPLVWTSKPAVVEASCLNAANHGYIVVVNHSSIEQHISLGSKLPIHSMQRILSSGAVATQNSRQLDLQPYEGAVLAWK